MEKISQLIECKAKWKTGNFTQQATIYFTYAGTLVSVFFIFVVGIQWIINAESQIIS
jgi:hypothetical protein